jgi:hydroxypyruvate isomerase
LFQLSASVSMVLPDLPLLERIQLLHHANLGVGLWDPTGLDLDAILATGARISIMDGFSTGNIAIPDAAEQMLASAEAMIPTAKKLGSPLMNLHGAKLSSDGPAIVPVNGVTHTMFDTAYKTLSRFAELGAEHDVVFGLENLNTVDHPGVPFASGEDVLDLVSRVDSPHLRVNFDVYHAARGGEDVGALLDAAATGLAAEIQLADSPTRHWPGKHRLDFPAIHRRLTAAGYSRSVALEAWILDDAADALNQFTNLFGKDPK